MNKFPLIALGAVVCTGLFFVIDRPVTAQAKSTMLYGKVSNFDRSGTFPVKITFKDPRTRRAVHTTTAKISVKDGAYYADVDTGDLETNTPYQVLIAGLGQAAQFRAVEFVELQPATPGTKQTGHINISGNIIANKIGLGVTSPTQKLHILDTTTTGAIQAISKGTALIARSTGQGGGAFGGLFQADGPFGFGIYGLALSGSGNTSGGIFESRSVAGTGVRGFHNAVGDTSGVGVEGETASATGIGVRALNTVSTGSGIALYAEAKSGDDGHASIVAVNTNTSAWGRALHAIGGGTTGDGIFVEANGGGTATYAGKFFTDGSTGRGIYAVATDGAGTNYGVYGQSNSATNGFGLWASGRSGASGTKLMVIDHPDDPANYILQQYVAEGSEPLMIYSGVVKLDARGNGVAALPSYFHSIAINPRYSLTAIGAAMPNLYIAREVVRSRFMISGGAPNKRVSWTVYATRNDPWVRAYGYQNVVRKPNNEVGNYIEPQLFGYTRIRKFGLQPREREELMRKQFNRKRPE